MSSELIGGIRIVDSQGRVADATSSELAVGSQLVTLTILTPVAPLEASETYLIMDGTMELAHFFVHGDMIERPQIPSLIRVEREADRAQGSSCGSVRSLRFVFDSPDTVVVRFGDAIALDDFESHPPGGEIEDFGTDVLGDGVSFGYGGNCQGWPSETDELAMQVGAFNAVGDFSGWSETQTFDRPRFDDDSGCSIADSPRTRSGAGWPWFVTALVAAFIGRARGMGRQSDG